MIRLVSASAERCSHGSVSHSKDCVPDMHRPQVGG